MKNILKLTVTLIVILTLMSSLSFSASEIEAVENISVNDVLSESDYYSINDIYGNQVELEDVDVNNEYYIITTNINTLGKTQKRLVTDFYVYHGYMDLVGRTESESYYYKYYTSTNQPYYKWQSETATPKVTYSENGFHYTDWSHYEKNTSTYKEKSTKNLKYTWDTNISSPTTQTAVFEAPANK